MTFPQTIEIPVPKFNLHELVTFRWKGTERASRITLRRYDLDEKCWFYGVAGVASLYPESFLESRE